MTMSPHSHLADAMKETSIILAAEAELDQDGTKQISKQRDLSQKISVRDQTEDCSERIKAQTEDSEKTKADLNDRAKAENIKLSKL